jgi:hypothetical protein
MWKNDRMEGDAEIMTADGQVMPSKFLNDRMVEAS